MSHIGLADLLGVRTKAIDWERPAYGALMICSVIPYIGWPLIVVNFFVMLAMVSKICDAVNSIPEKLPDQEAGGPAFHVL